jgi:hypothetical protein
MASNYVEKVLYNDGSDEDLTALVYSGTVPGNVDLSYVANGAWQFATNVPRREKVDYAAGGGGGVTYHIDEL